MNLQPCKHCGKGLAPTAKSCPECGGPTQRASDEAANKQIGVVAVVILAVIIGGGFAWRQYVKNYNQKLRDEAAELGKQADQIRNRIINN